ncbi:MAG: hypothetical protein ABI761_17660 [Saprospiraceae bacterium]
MILLMICVVSCNSIDNNQLDRDSQLLAGLYCKAKEIRIRRFDLADRIRFTEDTLIMKEFKSNFFYQKRLDSLSAFKEPLTNLTKILSDSIFITQKKLYSKIYNSPEKKNLLDLAFKQAVEKICPD